MKKLKKPEIEKKQIIKKIEFSDTDKIFCMGRSGCGKSFLAKRIQEKYPRKIIFDTLFEYETKNVDSVDNFNSFCEKLKKINKEKPKQFTLIYRLDLDSDDNTIELDEALKLIYHLGDCLVVIEEVQIFASSHNIPKWLKNIVLTGRHQNIGVLFTSQRMGEINKTILSQCGHLFIGNMVEQNDQKYISGFIGDDVVELAGLQDREFIYFGRAGKFKMKNDLKF